MPVIFKHTPRPKFRPDASTSSFGSQQRGPKPYLGVLEGAPPGHGRRLRQRGSIFLHRGSVRARHSINRLRYRGSSIKRFIQNPRLLIKLIKDTYHKRHLKHLIPLIFVLLYMLLGAVLFFTIEAANEREKLGRRDTVYSAERLMFVKRVEEIIVDTASPPNTTKRRQFVEEAVDHLRTQLGHGPPPPEPEWTFMTSMYFAGTIFTTIGYGDIACETIVGQVVTVAYAIFGIPLMLITLNELGKFLYKTINEFMAMLTNRWKALTKSKWFGKKDKKSKDGETEPEKGMEMNHVDERKMSNQKSPDDMKAVSFNLNSTHEDISLQMEVATDDPIRAGSPKSVPSAGTTQSGGDLGVMMEEDEASEEEGNEYDEYQGGHDSESRHSQMGAAAPRMHVMVAILTTFTWIFLCAAMFKLWEKNWTYWNSLYFMFISLLTIGLGDVNVQRRDLMVLCFIFVIIGLSLVSMCINVIQSSLEDLYRKMLMKILVDYQASLNKDGSHKNASLGVMKALGGSKTAKFLVPLMSENTKRAVMQQVQEEAKDAGFEIPPIFENFETINEIIANKDMVKDEEARSAMIEEILKPIVTSESSIHIERLVSYNLRENHTQTDKVQSNDKNDQTMRAEKDEMAVQTERSSSEGPKNKATGVDSAQQTDRIKAQDEGNQTATVSTKEAAVMTTATKVSSRSRGKPVQATQTERELGVDEEVQCRVRVGTFDGVTQTDEKPSKNQRIQTPIPVLANAEAQTDEINPYLEKIHGSKIREAGRRIQRVFNARSHSKGSNQEPAMSGWQEFSSDESIDWDPYDGLHAEKQKPVSQLKKMFDEGEFQQRPGPSSFRRKGTAEEFPQRPAPSSFRRKSTIELKRVNEPDRP